MVDPKLEERIKKSLTDGRLSCAVALGIARSLKITPRQVGDAANELKIKLANCQLGCFK